MDATQLLTRRDAEAVLGRDADRFDASPGPVTPRAEFVCFGARGTHAAMLGEFLSLALAPSTDADRHVPFFSVAVETEAGTPDRRPRRSVSARWEQAGRRFALTYTCVSVAETDDVDAATAAKRDAVAALARVLSDRVATISRA